MEIQSSILTWKIPWAEDPGGLHPMGSQRAGHNWGTNTHIVDLQCCVSFVRTAKWFSYTYQLLFSHSVVSNSSRPHRLQPARLPCPSPSPRVCSNSCPLSQDAIQPSHPLSSPSPPVFHLSQHQGVFQWVSSAYQMAKVLELQLQHQSFQWIFRVDFL